MSRTREPASSRCRYSAGGLLSAFGHNPTIAIRDFSGEARSEPRRYRTVFAQSDDPGSVVDGQGRYFRQGSARNRAHACSRRFWRVSSYPEIVYECSNSAATKAGEGQYSVTLNGDLTMHGITHSQPVAARVALSGDSLRAFGSFYDPQTDYDLKLASVAGGAMKVKDELKFSFNILARKKE